jgi:hypothetical protein
MINSHCTPICTNSSHHSNTHINSLSTPMLNPINQQQVLSPTRLSTETPKFHHIIIRLTHACANTRLLTNRVGERMDVFRYHRRQRPRNTEASRQIFIKNNIVRKEIFAREIMDMPTNTVSFITDKNRTKMFRTCFSSSFIQNSNITVTAPDPKMG